MKFYETHFEDYCKSHERFLATLPQDASAVTQEGAGWSLSVAPTTDTPKNMIVYGPSGVGKYTRVLSMLKPYSPSQLKHDKKIKLTTDKQSYSYRISDIHYEVDMSLLGCNSKVLWHEIYKQIVDIITIKPEKIGFIVCKNFHAIHNELLEIFYSYMQQHCYGYEGRSREVQIYFILITEHYSFIPNPILNRCRLLRVPRPSKQDIVTFANIYKDKDEHKVNEILNHIDTDSIVNLKETYSFAIVPSVHELPQDHFNMVCDTIIQEMHTILEDIRQRDKSDESDKSDEPAEPQRDEDSGAGGAVPPATTLTHFRDCLYDILIYNLDGIECIWYIFHHFVLHGWFPEPSSTLVALMYKLSVILKQYGNNYRSIFHLESAIFSILEAASKKIPSAST